MTTCPSWCTGEDGHDAHHLDEQGMRTHDRLFGRVVCSESTPRPVTVSVYIVQAETVEDDGRIERHPPGIWLSNVVDVADDLSANEARGLAVMLVAAASELDAMTGPPGRGPGRRAP